MATDDVAEAEAGFLPRFLGAVCGGAGSSCSDFLFLPGWDFVDTRAGDAAFEAAEVVPLEGSALKGILTSSLPGVFSTTRFMATPSVA